METHEIIELCKKHTIYNWSASHRVDPLPVARAEGVYFWTPEGKRFLDFNSQLMSVHIGHNHPKVVDAMKQALDELIYIYPGAATRQRAELGQLLASFMPGDINTFFFTLGGADANEHALRSARQYTGRYKILSRYRSYHGGTNATMQLTGEPRRWVNEPGMPGVVHVMDPEPYHFSFGRTDAEKTQANLRYLEEVIMYEGPQNIAAMIIESVTGTNGILPPPAGYLKGLRALLDKYDILLICDEVMSGFGRTGKRFAFEHGDIVPDMVTMAKGLTSSYFPLGALGLSDKIAAFYQENEFWGGMTYNSHPLGLATSKAVLNVFLEEDLVARAEKMGMVMATLLKELAEKHPSVRDVRSVGLFGIVELAKNAAGDYLAAYNETPPIMETLRAFFLEEGLYTYIRWGAFMCNPPLCITEEQLREGFAIFDRALDLVDAALEK